MYIEIMPGENTAEAEMGKPSIGEQIFNEFKSHDHGLFRKEDVVKQVDILRRLPTNLVEQAYGYLLSEKVNKENFIKNHPEVKETPFDDRICIEGFANEVLANIQIRQTQPELRGNIEPTLRAELDNYENKILEVANNSERYNLLFNSGRNPDVAWLDLDSDGRVIIKGIGEITTSHQLDKRKYLQLSESGFASSLRYTARRLNNLTDGESRGLPEFGIGKKQVEVASKLKRYIVVNHDMDTTPEGLVNVIGQTVSDEEFSHLDYADKKKKFSVTEKQSFLDLLTSPDTVIIKSAFSNNESKLIASLLINKIQEKYPSYQFNNNNNNGR